MVSININMIKALLNLFTERHQRAKLRIKDEPDATTEGVVTIRFVLPSSAKVSRRFRVDNSVEVRIFCLVLFRLNTTNQ
jgi:hypothetical protein